MDENGEVSEIRAALYVRKATKHQQYSTDNQSDKIRVRTAVQNSATVAAG
jgi:hypothetical protein